MEKNLKKEVSSCTILLCVYIHLFLIRTSLSFFFLDVTEKVFPLIIFLFIGETSCQSDRLFVCVLYRIYTLYDTHCTFFELHSLPSLCPTPKFFTQQIITSPPLLCVCVCVWMWVSGFPFFNFLNNCEMIINTGKKRWQSFFNEITSCTWLVIISLVYSQLFFSWSEWLYSTRIDYLDRDDSDWPLHHVSI